MSDARTESTSLVRWRWIILTIVVVAALGYGWFVSRQPTTAQAADLPTAKVTKESIQQTLRVTGITAALDTYSVVAPQLRGSRGNRGRSANATASIAALSSSTVNAKNTQTSTGSSTSSSPTSALKAATSRVSGLASSQATTTNKSAAATSAASSSGGSSSSGSSLGSTASGLVNYSGGDRRGDFDLILQFLAPSGSLVKKGDVIARFDAELMTLRAEDYKASLRQTEEGVNILKANLQVTKKAYQQSLDVARGAMEKAQLDLKTLPVLGQLDSDRLKLLYEEGKARYEETLKEGQYREQSDASQLKQAELDLAQAQLELQRAQANIDRLTVKAPVDGMVVVKQTWIRGDIRRYRIGDQMRPGQNFMDVVSAGTMVLNATLNQVDAQRLRVGQTAMVSFDAYAGLRLAAHVLKVGSLASGDNRATYVMSIPIQLQLDETDSRVIPDLTARADVVLQGSEPETVVPLTAVQREGSKTFVWARQGEGWTKRAVTLGMADHVKVAVKEGLREGEVVALRTPVTTGQEQAR